MDTWGPPVLPAPGPRKASLDQVPHYFLPKSPTRRTPGSADHEGLRPHAPTLEEASQANFFLAQKPNLIRTRTQTQITNWTCPSPQPRLHFRPKSGSPCVHGWFPKPRQVCSQEAWPPNLHMDLDDCREIQERKRKSRKKNPLCRSVDSNETGRFTA